ncbi:MAG: beta-N-acetylhexosaminidase, partial [Gammaproteobacteria bacterium]|nr:beta-N-acetylhexosaminidase [Gammaproteobacteria bacterium]
MPLGPLMLDLEGLEVSAEEREILQHPLVGGLIFFTRNYREPKQLVELVKQVRDARRDILICVDHEGGRVQRFRDGFSRIPACGKFGEIYEQDKARGISLSKQAGWLMAAELRAYDIDFSFAPVLDLDYGVSAVIGNRAYHSDPDKAFELARAYILGMLEAGMANVGKHYPGHGAVAEDSHLDLPRDRRSLDEIMSRDVVPFRRLNEEGLLNAVMPAHVVYEEVDSQPAGFSKRWISEILRQDLSF